MLKKLTTVINEWEYRNFNNESIRKSWVEQQLSLLEPGGKLLDAGAGTQQYRKYCSHLIYVAQDFDAFSVDAESSMTTTQFPYKYGETDLVCDILSIQVPDKSFEHVLCTEVLEHVPKPVDAVRELSRVLKSGGTLILTVPMNCLRHFDPYFFTSGLTDNWINSTLEECGFVVQTLEPVGVYFSWMKVEVFRTLGQSKFNPLAWLLLAPALVFYSLKKRTDSSVSTLCMGYHVVAQKKG